METFPRPSGGHAAPDGKILVVDDDASIRETLTTMLRFKGYRAHAVGTGREALDRMRAEPPDLVLLDVMMPEMDGISVCREVKADRQLADIRVLMLTARDGRGHVVQALDAGASDYVTKPFFIDELAARIRTNLEIKRQQDDLQAMLRISQAVSSSLDIDEVLLTIVNELADAVGSDRASLIRIADESTGYVVATRDDPDLRNKRLDLADYPEILQATRGDSEVVIDDSHESPLLAAVRERIPVRKSIMIVPLSPRGASPGTHVLRSSREFRPYTEREIQFARFVASAAANGLANAELYENVEADKRRLERLANTDDLTKLHNHRHFYKRLGEEYKRSERYESDLALILLDLDHFKRVNDTYGHQKGDDVLREFAHALSSVTRETDLLARYGGEEFALLLPQTNLAGAFQQAERLRGQIKGHYFEALEGEPLTVSCGVACLPFSDPGFEPPERRQDTLIGRADDALYTAKRGGRDQTVTSDGPGGGSE